MKIEEALQQRYSCRKYSEKRIPEESLKKILWAGSRAPFASGGPRREFVVVTEKNIKNKLELACHKQKYVGECSSVIVVCGIDEETKLKSGFPKFVHDCDAATMCMILQAVELGIDSCWIGHFKVDEIRNILNIKSRPTVVLLLGYDRNKEKT